MVAYSMNLMTCSITRGQTPYVEQFLAYSLDGRWATKRIVIQLDSSPWCSISETCVCESGSSSASV
ncbi:hypothetical protein LINPERPRIM_LOCUS26585 [Linum perenne]